MVIVKNTELKTYCKENIYELYRPTLVTYEYDGAYYLVSDKVEDNSIFTSDDYINLKLNKYFFTKDIIEQSKQKKEQTVLEALEKQKEEEKKTPKLVDFKKLKVAELRSLCLQYHIPIQEMGKNGKMKYVVKKELVEKLKIILQ